MSKTVVITGCSSGIGFSSAKFLMANGYRVIATVRTEKDKALLGDEGINDVVIMDLASSESIQQAVREIEIMADGDVYAIFNNGAYGQPGAVEDLTRDVLRQQFEVNLFGTHEFTCAMLPMLLKQENARIIQNSSVLGFAAMPMRGAYNASKFALEGLTDTLRLELSQTSNIDVVLIEPGPIATAFRRNALDALHRNIDMESSRHKSFYDASLARLNRKGANSSFTLPPEAVAKKLLIALNSAKPKARYYVTFPTYLFAFLRHVLPTRLLDKLLIKAGGV